MITPTRKSLERRSYNFFSKFREGTRINIYLPRRHRGTEKIVQRPGWVTGMIVAQFLCAVLFAGTCVFLFGLIYQQEISEAADRAAVIHGLKLSVGIVAAIALVVFIGAWGLLKSRLWGWWLALLIDIGLFGIFLYSMVDDGPANIDWDVFAFTVIALALVLWLILPPVRRFYWKESDLHAPGTKF